MQLALQDPEVLQRARLRRPRARAARPQKASRLRRRRRRRRRRAAAPGPRPPESRVRLRVGFWYGFWFKLSLGSRRTAAPAAFSRCRDQGGARRAEAPRYAAAPGGSPPRSSRTASPRLQGSRTRPAQARWPRPTASNSACARDQSGLHDARRAAHVDQPVRLGGGPRREDLLVRSVFTVAAVLTVAGHALRCDGSSKCHREYSTARVLSRHFCHEVYYFRASWTSPLYKRK